mmetsp:Transcript_14460/g.28579  ORF Transcript_14460/g.28579 Transcript_14460/m.28579 type:complete len:91 (-) Transcript_14460:307-579(-)
MREPWGDFLPASIERKCLGCTRSEAARYGPSSFRKVLPAVAAARGLPPEEIRELTRQRLPRVMPEHQNVVGFTTFAEIERELDTISRAAP